MFWRCARNPPRRTKAGRDETTDQFRRIVDAWLSRNWGAISEDCALPELDILRREIQSLLRTDLRPLQ